MSSETIERSVSSGTTPANTRRATWRTLSATCGVVDHRRRQRRELHARRAAQRGRHADATSVDPTQNGLSDVEIERTHRPAQHRPVRDDVEGLPGMDLRDAHHGRRAGIEVAGDDRL